MPVQSCSLNGKPGYQYGDSGRCYTYSRGNDASRKRAKRKAYLQGAAIEANRGGKLKEMSEDVQEYDDSINDYVDLIRAEFEKSYYAQNNPAGNSYVYVTDVFESYVVVRDSKNKYYEVGFTETEESIEFEPRENWVAVKLSYVQEFLSGAFHDVMVVSEFKGKYPDIPIFDDVDLDQLTAGDPNPVFVTLPIGKANVKSGNNRYYDDKFLQEYENQVKSVKPIGIMGHLSKEQRATAFPAEAVHWVGVKRVSEILWGKGYVPPGEARERLQRYKATNKKIGTSIDGEADGTWDPKLGAYVIDGSTFQLKQIDIGPADRIGVPDLAAVPLLTTEMLDPGEVSIVARETLFVEVEMDRDEVIKGLKPEDVASLPDSVKATIAAEQMTAVRKQLGLPESMTLAEMVSSIQQREEDQRKKLVSLKITELVDDPETGIKLKGVRKLVTELIEAKSPATAEEAEKLYTEIVDSAEVKEALALKVQEIMGPKQTTPIEPKTAEKKGKYFIIPSLGE